MQHDGAPGGMCFGPDRVRRFRHGVQTRRKRVVSVPFLPKTAPFAAEDIDSAEPARAAVDAAAAALGLSGFLAGLDAAQGGRAPACGSSARSGAAPARSAHYSLWQRVREYLRRWPSRLRSLPPNRTTTPASSIWRMPDLAQLAKVEEPHRLHLDLGRGRPAAAAPWISIRP